MLDLTRYLPGAYATLVLADLGSEVIKVEEPRRGDPMRHLPPVVDGESIYFHLLNRNKKSVALDLKSPAGVDAFLRLARAADVVIEGMRPGVAPRLGIGYESVREVNPGIVYCSLSGYGQDGPLRDRPGHDLSYEARGGLLSLFRRDGRMIALPPVQIADLAGAMNAVASILAALFDCARGGPGRHLDVSLHEAAMQWTMFAQSEDQIEGRSPQQGESILTGRYAFYGVYETADAKLLALALPERKFWENFCEAIGRRDLISRFDEQPAAALRDEIAHTIRTETSAQWLSRFDGRDICCDPVMDISELRADPQVLHRRVFAALPVGALSLLCPLFDPRLDGAAVLPAPGLGEHTREIMGGTELHGDDPERPFPRA